MVGVVSGKVVTAAASLTVGCGSGVNCRESGGSVCQVPLDRWSKRDQELFVCTFTSSTYCEVDKEEYQMRKA